MDTCSLNSLKHTLLTHPINAPVDTSINFLCQPIHTCLPVLALTPLSSSLHSPHHTHTIHPHLPHTHTQTSHPNMLELLHYLGEAYWKGGRYTDASSLCIRVISYRNEVLGLNHPDTLRTMHIAAMIYTRCNYYTHCRSTNNLHSGFVTDNITMTDFRTMHIATMMYNRCYHSLRHCTNNFPSCCTTCNTP